MIASRVPSLNGETNHLRSSGSTTPNMESSVSSLTQYGSFRKPTFPLSNSCRHKPRRWPLALRFIKGAIHHLILVPITLHTLFTCIIVYIHINIQSLSVPANIVPSLSIVVGLMLVFRNSSSYDRYWGGRTNLQSIGTSVRNLTRSFLVCGPDKDDADRRETEKVVKVLVGMLYAVKNHLRSTWGHGYLLPEYKGLLPDGMYGFESEGVGLVLELAVVVERYIKRGVERGAFNAPQSSMLSSQLNSLIDAYGKMETIKLTPIPIAHQIHQKQVLALYCCVLPFCLVDELGWLCVPIICLICFMLYGIEGIGEEIEDPFGSDKNDIKIDAIIEDLRQEVSVLLDSWRRGGEEYTI